MGDISAEPSMEEILSSIKRIIAEEGESASASRARRTARQVPPRIDPGSFGHDEILELSDPMRSIVEDVLEEEPILAHRPITREPAGSEPVSRAPITPPRADPPPSAPPPSAPTPSAPLVSAPTSAAPQSATSTAAEPVDPILSPRAAQASRGALDALSRAVVKPEIAGNDSLEALVREMLRPMLREWLDTNLPAMVETMVSREISRITGSR